MGHSLDLALVEGRFAVCRLAADQEIPQWAGGGAFCSITRTPDELSIVCEDSAVPAEIRAERGWRMLRVAGPLDFSLTGVLSAIAGPLAEARISLFALSTFDTDYVMVRESDMENAMATLAAAGHRVAPPAMMLT